MHALQAAPPGTRRGRAICPHRCPHCGPGPGRGARTRAPTRASPRRRVRGRAEPLPAQDTKRLRGSPPHLQHGAPRAFENHRSPLRRARHSPGLPVPPGATAAAAISSRSPSPRPRCQVTPFTWAWSSLRRASASTPPAGACGDYAAPSSPAARARPAATAHSRLENPAPPPPRPHAPLAPLAPRPHEREPVIGQSAAVKG